MKKKTYKQPKECQCRCEVCIEKKKQTLANVFLQLSQNPLITTDAKMKELFNKIIKLHEQ